MHFNFDFLELDLESDFLFSNFYVIFLATQIFKIERGRFDDFVGKHGY